MRKIGLVLFIATAMIGISGVSHAEVACKSVVFTFPLEGGPYRLQSGWELPPQMTSSSGALGALASCKRGPVANNKYLVTLPYAGWSGVVTYRVTISGCSPAKRQIGVFQDVAVSKTGTNPASVVIDGGTGESC